MTCHSWDVACCFPVGALAFALRCIAVTNDSPIPGLLTVLSHGVPSVHTNTTQMWALSTNLQGSSQAFLRGPHFHRPTKPTRKVRGRDWFQRKLNPETRKPPPFSSSSSSPSAETCDQCPSGSECLENREHQEQKGRWCYWENSPQLPLEIQLAATTNTVHRLLSGVRLNA